MSGFRATRGRRALVAALALGALVGCKRGEDVATADAGVELDASEPVAAMSVVLPPENTAPPAPSGPVLGITSYVGTVYKEPRDTSKKLGYLRVGAIIARAEEPEGKAGCPGGWYRIQPAGYVCVGKDATLDMQDPILKAASKRPNLAKPMPYRYGFVRAVLPLYLRVPTAEEQDKSEFKLKEHLQWFVDNHEDVQKVALGADDVPIDAQGVPLANKQVGELGRGRSSLEMSRGELFGGDSDDDPIPFWLQGGKRLIPNISDFVVPDYAVFADRARRHTGLAFVGSFPTGSDAYQRRFAITTDLRLAPTTKVKPDAGSPWHGTALDDNLTLPVAYVRAQGARSYDLSSGKAIPGDPLDYRSLHALTGKQKKVEGVKYYRTKSGAWLHQLDVGLALTPAGFPEAAEKGEKWIEISIGNQTLTLWEGKKPVYVTLISSGQAGLDDPKKTTATVRGFFRIRNKHISATMDSNESSSVGGKADTTAFEDGDEPTGLRRAQKKPTKPGEKAKGAGAKGAPSKPDPKGAASAPAKVPRKGDGEYGVTKRRGEGTFQLRDVPYIQYFESGYALHAAYWHDVFGTPRSHGCVNLSPVDAHRVFLFTDPPVPDGWHAINTGEELGQGTVVIIHE